MRPDDDVSFVTIAQALSEAGTDLSPFDIICISAAFKVTLEEQNPKIFDGKKLCLLPTILFYGFHPDNSYMTYDGKVLKLLGQDYHSSVAWLGFRLGLSVDKTLALYQPNVLKRFRLAEIYQQEKQALISNFKTHGLDLEKHFAKWSRTGCYMHSVNHPRIDVVYDIARECLRVNGLGAVTHTPHDTMPVFSDNLANGTVLPVFPPVAEGLGLRGSTNYKLANDRIYSQREFITASHTLYASMDPEKMEHATKHLTLEKMKSAISLPERSLTP